MKLGSAVITHDHKSMISDAALLTAQHYICLVVRSLAIITLSVLSTVSGCYYLTGVQIITTGGFVMWLPVTS